MHFRRIEISYVPSWLNTNEKINYFEVIVNSSYLCKNKTPFLYLKPQFHNQINTKLLKHIPKFLTYIIEKVSKRL